jgi:hypothetical protein
VLRLPKDLAFNGSTTEFFAPSDWLRLDDVVSRPLLSCRAPLT